MQCSDNLRVDISPQYSGETKGADISACEHISSSLNSEEDKHQYADSGGEATTRLLKSSEENLLDLHCADVKDQPSKSFVYTKTATTGVRQECHELFLNEPEAPPGMCRITSKDIDDILNVNVSDSELLTYSIPKETSFRLPSDCWMKLRAAQRGRYFVKGTWQHHFVAGIKESNTFCSFAFKNHTVTQRRSSEIDITHHDLSPHPLFTAFGRCTFSNCPVTVQLSMFTPHMVNVAYSGQIRHKKTECQSRPIRKGQREILKKDFMHGIKPLKKYLDVVETLDNDLLVSGNCDNLGKTTQVFSQISSESKQHRLDKDCIQSLLKQQSLMKSECTSGFIQKICASPCYVFYWSEEGLKLFHKYSCDYALFWDATGSIVRKSDEGKQFLYYELAMENPKEHQMGIPIAAMITEDQSLPTVLDWMSCFRQAEKKKYGYCHLVVPKIIVSDQSWVFILTAMNIFNGENLQQYLQRTWDALTGNTSQGNLRSSNKTVIHLCSSHVMNKLKKFVKDSCRSKMNLALYILSLMMNCRSLSDAECIVRDLCVALLVPKLNDTAKNSIQRLLNNINNFTVVDDSEEIQPEDVSQEADKILQPGRYTEENFMTMSTQSPFKIWANHIKAEVLEKYKNVQSDEINDYYCEVLANDIFVKYLPILPLWSAIACPELSSIDNDFLSRARTSGVIENRFRLLKHVCLGSRKQLRLDDFSAELKTHTCSIQRLVVRNCMKLRTPRGSRTKKTDTLKEKWNKKFPDRTGIKSKIGKYQRPPKHKFFFSNQRRRRVNPTDAEACEDKADVAAHYKDFDKSDSDHNYSVTLERERIDVKYGKGCKRSSLMAAAIRKPFNISPVKMQDTKSTVVDSNEDLPDIDDNVKSFDTDDRISPLRICEGTAPESDINTALPQISSTTCESLLYSTYAISNTQSLHQMLNEQCTLENINMTSCWLISFIQAISYSQVSELILNTISSGLISILDDGDDVMYQAKTAILAILKFIFVNKAEAARVPQNLLTAALNAIARASCSDSSDLNTAALPRQRQNDIDEFNKVIFTTFAADIKEYMTVTSVYTCTSGQCPYMNTVNDLCHQTLYLYPQNISTETSVRKLIKEFFQTTTLHTSRCEYCSSKYERKEKLSRLPKTLFVCVKRYNCTTVMDLRSKSGRTITRKNHCTITPDEIIDLKDFTAENNENLTTQYRLSSIICHYGNTCTSGHYATFLFHPLSGTYIKCDDTSITLGNGREIEQNGYYYIYDVLLPNLMPGVVSIIDFLGKSKGFKDALDISKNCLLGQDLFNTRLTALINSQVHHFIRGIQLHLLGSNDVTKYLFDHIKDFKSTLHVMLSFMFDQCDSTRQVGHDCFYTVTNCINICKCGNVSVQTDYISFVEVIQFPVVDILPRQSILKQEQYCSMCNHVMTKKYVISSMPKSLVIYINRNNVRCNITSDLSKGVQIDTKTLKYALPYICNRRYSCQSVFYINDTESIMILCEIPSKSTFASYIQQQRGDNGKTILVVDGQNVQLKSDGNSQAVNRVLTPGAWLRTSDIDEYMQLLKRTCPNEVYSFETSFFSNNLFYNSNINYPRNTTSVYYEPNFLQFQHVLVPVNVNNSHWILLVVDCLSKVIRYCDSLGDYDDKILQQLWYFLTYQTISNTGIVLDIAEWKIIEYVKEEPLLRQADDSSCGVYVCAMAKSIILNISIRPTSTNRINAANHLRSHIAFDLMHNTISF